MNNLIYTERLTDEQLRNYHYLLICMQYFINIFKCDKKYKCELPFCDKKKYFNDIYCKKLALLQFFSLWCFFKIELVFFLTLVPPSLVPLH